MLFLSLSPATSERPNKARLANEWIQLLLMERIDKALGQTDGSMGLARQARSDRIYCCARISCYASTWLGISLENDMRVQAEILCGFDLGRITAERHHFDSFGAKVHWSLKAKTITFRRSDVKYRIRFVSSLTLHRLDIFRADFHGSKTSAQRINVCVVWRP
jgi:hypothetical protein